MSNTGKEIQQWVDPAMYAAEPMQSSGPKVTLISATPDPLGAIAAASKIYKGEVCRSTLELTDEERRYYWEQSQATHLRAPHEFMDLHFLIEGVTRGFTHQLVRQRTAVYAQESLRFAVKEALSEEVALPPSIAKGSEAEEVWDKAIDEIERAYKVLINRFDIPAEDARGLLPTNVMTRVHYKTNLRNLVEHAGNRLCTQAQFEWKQVFNEIVRAIANYKPPKFQNELPWKSQDWQFETIAQSELFRPVCYAKGKCPFKADFDRNCTIRPRVEEGKFDEIDTSEWLLDPAAARRGVG